jgi:hypothetical protein
MDRGRRGFLTKLVGVAGAAVVPIPGTALSDTANLRTTHESKRVFGRDPFGTRDRATDEPVPKQDYGLMVQSDTYSPNPDLTRLRHDGAVADRTGTTSVYVRAWIDEEVYGIRDPHTGVINRQRQDIVSRAFAEAVIAADRIMTPTLKILRNGALREQAMKAGIAVPHEAADTGKSSRSIPEWP